MPQRMGQGNQNRTDDSGGRVCKAAVTGDGIRLASLNICTGRVGGLDTALRALQPGNVDVGFLQEMKLTQGINTRNGAGYDVWAIEPESRH